MNRSDQLSAWLDGLQARGQYVFAGEEATDPSRGPGFDRTTLWRAVRAGRLVAPRQGFYVIVPPEHRAVGAPPAEWFIDGLMRHEQLPYYVGLLTAAALHGASAQAAQEFQVMVPEHRRPLAPGRLRIRFFTRRDAERAAVEQRVTPTGYMRVATPETTALDVVGDPKHAGGWDNVATVLRDLSERIDADRLRRVLDAGASQADAQRLGYILQFVGAAPQADAVAGWLKQRRPHYVPLAPSAGGVGKPDPRWHVLVNRVLQPD